MEKAPLVPSVISHYKILEKLGEGGMGVVYKAQDTKLDRIVALKFLPHNLTPNDDDKARFLQEAKAASALNHPNVCTIFDIREENDEQFIVMEFVEGKTLTQIVPLQKIQTAIEYAIQIGDALKEAHSKGIVHRDIKADNIMVNTKGQIKVMDFGLAKLRGSLKLTRTSSTVGTLAYMAPEQIQNGEVDARSDIFSFGVVLYEMLTGHTPFKGDHEAALMYSVLNDEPESLERVVPAAPSELLHIVNRALEKNPEERYQSAHDMVIDLRRLKRESTKISRVIPVQQPSSGSQQQISFIGASERPQRQLSKNKLWIGLAVLTIASAAGLYLYFTNVSRQTSGASLSTTLNPNMTLHTLQIPFTQVSYPGISSDGNWVSFAGGDRNGKWDIYYMHTSSSEPKRITNDSMTFREQGSDISPDGSQVAYTQPNGLYVASSLGGASRKIVEDVGMVRWRPDAQRLGYVGFHKKGRSYYEFWSIKPDGTDKRLEFADSAGTLGRFSFAWSPDGRSVAWIRTFEGRYQEVITRELGSGKELQLTFDKKNNDDVCWLRNGMILFSSNKSGNTNLWVVPATGGTAQQVTKGSGPDIGIAASADAKKIVYLQQQPVGYVWIASMLHPDAQQVTFDDRDIRDACFSHDRKRLAIVMADPDPLKPDVQLYVIDRDGNNRRKMTDDEMLKVNVSWSPDGKWITYNSFLFGQLIMDSLKVCLLDAEHEGPPKIITAGWNLGWITNSSFVIKREGKLYNESVSLENPVPQKIFEDSTYASPVASGNLIFFYDSRKGREGNWIIPADYRQNPSHNKPYLIEKAEDVLRAHTRSEYYYFENKRHEWWRYQYNSGKRERLNVSFPGLNAGSPANLSSDDEEMVYIVPNRRGKLVMIENLFQ
jgi:serine/threonine protein kinase